MLFSQKIPASESPPGSPQYMLLRHKSEIIRRRTAECVFAPVTKWVKRLKNEVSTIQLDSRCKPKKSHDFEIQNNGTNDRQLSPGTANSPQLIPVTQLVFRSVGLWVTGFVLLSWEPRMDCRDVNKPGKWHEHYATSKAVTTYPALSIYQVHRHRWTYIQGETESNTGRISNYGL